MKLKGKCNCSEKLTCGCTLSFSSHVASSTSVLDVGTLQGGTCTFAAYVIDWYRDGVFYMTSGIGSAPGITAFHPFTGAAAIPVPGGTYVPVVRYVILTGQTTKIFLKPTPCQDYCDFSGTLPTITVSSIYCGLIGGTPATNYDYRVAYTTTQDYSLASRKVLFNLISSAVHFAIQVKGYSIADRFKVWLNNYETLLQDWIVGSDSGSQTYTFPIKYPSVGDVKILTALPAWVAGNFLTIEIFPAVVSGNTNTQWDINMKCLDASIIMEYDYFKIGMRKFLIETATFTFNSTLCRYEFTMEFEVGLINNTNLNLAKYAFEGNYYQNLTFNTAAKTITHFIPYSTSITNFYYSMPGQVKQTYPSGAFYYTKAARVFTFEYIDQADYDLQKTGYNAMINSATGLLWSTNPTNLHYYQVWRWETYLTATQCGDNEISRQWQVTRQCSIVWDDANKTITVTAPVISNGYTDPAVPCNTIMTGITQVCNNCNSNVGTTNTARTLTKCANKYLFSQIQYPSINNPATNSIASYSYSHYKSNAPQLLTETAVSNSSAVQTAYCYYAYLEITATRDGNGNWITDPLQNFRLWYRLSKTTYNYVAPGTLIYEKVNGVVTIAIPYNSF